MGRTAKEQPVHITRSLVGRQIIIDRIIDMADCWYIFFWQEVLQTLAVAAPGLIWPVHPQPAQEVLVGLVPFAGLLVLGF